MIDYQFEKEQNPKRVPGTCLWTLQNPKYLDWRDNNTKRLIWISADPGCGKSVLARCIVDEDLPKAFTSVQSRHVLYYFFKDISFERRSVSRALCAILYQLFTVCPQLIRHALPKYEKRGATLSTTLSELWSIFITATADPVAGDVVCVLDALDECNDQERPNLIEYLERSCLGQGTAPSSSRPKFLVTSRPYFEIRRGFDKLLEASNNIELAGNDESASIKKEIDLVIEHKVTSLKRENCLCQEVTDHLHKRLSEIEHRTYLWLHLLWKIIQKDLLGTKSDMDKLIDNLPDNIQESYDVLLNRCPNRDFARKVLQIVLVAARPLTLVEMDFALYIDNRTLSYTELDGEGPDRLRETLPSRCGLIISVIEDKLYFIHQTVRDFLLKEDGTQRTTGRVWQQSIDFQESHAVLAEACLRNLSLPGIHINQTNCLNALIPEDRREIQPTAYCQGFTFLSYSAIYWADHFRHSLGNPERTEFATSLLQGNDQVSSIGRYGSDCDFGLQAASIGGLKDVVQTLLDKGADVNVQGWQYGNALLAASSGGHQDIVQMLLDKGANINAQVGWYSIYSEGEWYGNALQAASSRGDQGVVQILLEKGADVNAQGGWFSNALCAASSEGHQDVVKILLDKGANINAQSIGYGSALCAASSGGYQDVVKTLLDKGADVNVQGGDDGNALQAASYEGYLHIIQVLLNKGANINAQGGRYGNALQAALYRGRQDIVQTLLDKGADVNTQGGHYGNALQTASSRGYQDIVQMLLNKGADINAQGGHYGNALQAASSEGHQDVVQTLLDKGADVNAQGGHYGNALQAASSKGRQDVVQILLEKGADVKAQGGILGNALQAASYAGHQNIVQTLLDKGAVVNAQGGFLGNALQAASFKGYLHIIQVLLDKEANINAQSGRYGSVLCAASFGGYQDIVKMLLDKGADVNAQGGRYSSALGAASSGGHQNVLRILLDKGADVNAQGGWYGNALQTASYRGRQDIVQTLLDEGADVNAQGERYDSALQAASSKGYQNVVRILLNKGADVNAQGGRYGSALQAALSEGYQNVVQILLNKGANVKA